jgi:2-polyprenyl-3-methyl-5-hydroxy-6-metoxy-1,4-benzoquinol methylase
VKREEIFRNTEVLYLEIKGYVSYDLIKFVTENAGKRILDLGCATGEYSKKLTELGYNCVGVDINSKYVEMARKEGLESYVMSAENLNFPNDYFDSVLLFEVLEHVDDPYDVLKEAVRVTKKNILISVPNSTKFNELIGQGLTYEHMLESDHKNFFTKNELEDLLSKISNKFKVEEVVPLPLGVINLPLWLKYPILFLYKCKIIKSNIFYRLIGIVEV